MDKGYIYEGIIKTSDGKGRLVTVIVHPGTDIKNDDNLRRKIEDFYQSGRPPETSFTEIEINATTKYKI